MGLCSAAAWASQLAGSMDVFAAAITAAVLIAHTTLLPALALRSRARGVLAACVLTAAGAAVLAVLNALAGRMGTAVLHGALAAATLVVAGMRPWRRA